MMKIQVLLLLLGLCAAAHAGCNKSLLRGKIIDGKKISQPRASSVGNCQARCTAIPRCAFFAYFTRWRLCKLMSKPHYVTYSYGGATSGYSLKDCRPKPPGKEECKKLAVDTMFHRTSSVGGIDNVASAEDCQKKCTAEPRCGFFQYYTSKWTGDYRKNYCALMSGLPGEKNSYGKGILVSGYSLNQCPKN